MKKYQLITPVLNHEEYCSVIDVYEEPLFFLSKNRERAIVYTEKELSKAKEYFENLGIAIMQKEVKISHKRTIDV